MSKHLLSKSSFLMGLQCEKQLYLYKHHYKLKDPVSEMQQAVFNRGKDVGILAQQLFPGGIDVSPESPFKYDEAIGKTRELIKNGTKTLYEASFIYEGVLVISDIVVKYGNKWKIYEVKSSTSVSETNELDAAIQYYVLSNSGVDISDISIIYINNEYTRFGSLNINELFIKESVMKKVQELQGFVAENVERLKKVIGKRKIPDINIGEHCTNPYTCSFYDYCWNDIPEDSVFDLSGMHLNKKFELYYDGIIKLDEIPEEMKLNKTSQLQLDSYRSGKTIIDRKNISEFLSDVSYPLYFMDFETFQPAVPLYDNSRPYQQIPFQWSLHYKKNKSGKLEHYEYLGEPGIDPRKKFIETLLKATEKSGDILVYNKSFEISRLNEFAGDFQDYGKEIDERISRIKDLMVPFQKKYYYTPEMKGSYSIKAVLPALVPELGYDSLDISEGSEASLAFERLLKETDMIKISEIRKQLLEYCKLDTLAMVRILEVLEKI